MEIRLNAKVYDLFHMFAGTSIGGIIALIFSQKKYSADQLLKKMMGKFKNEIFSTNWLWFLKGYLYDAEKLESLLKEEFRNINRAEIDMRASNGNYFITSNILNNDKSIYPCAFVRYNDKNINDAELYEIDNKFQFNRRDNFDDTKLYQIGRATSAAAPYFKHIEIKNLKFIDGGFSYNNPSEWYINTL